MPKLKWQSSTLKEGVFQDNLIDELKQTTKEFLTTKGTYRYFDDAKKKDGEIIFKTDSGNNYYLTMEFKRDTTLNLLSNIAQMIHYEYQASDGGNDPLMENYGGIIVCQSTIIFLEYNKVPQLFNDLYKLYSILNTSTASKIYSDYPAVQVIMKKYEEELRKYCVFYHMDQHEYYTPIFEDIVQNLKKRLK